MSNLTILNTAIRQIDNLFCLNDFHAISGNEAKHQPNRFIRLDTTQELVAEIQKEDPTAIAVKSLRGTQGGTYACEEIALAYAMWISPKFHLVVLRAFLAMHKGQSQQSQPNLPLAEPEPERKPDVVIPYEDAFWIAKYLVRAKAFGKEVEVMHRKLFEQLGVAHYTRNDLAAKGYDLAHEYNHKLDPFIEQVLPQTQTQRKRLAHTNF